MARLPFDPERLPDRVAGASAGARAEAGAMSVTQANRLVKETLAQALPAKLRITGQVSNFNDRGHWYFSLKDAGSSMRCVCFASTARRSRLPMSDGLEVVVTGRFDVYDAQGALQFYVDKIEPVGQGALELAFRALCDELRGKGYFDQERKKRLPAFPTHVAVVTSHAAAALQDVINTAAKRWRGCRLSLMDVRVQGDGAAVEIATAIDTLSRLGRRAGVDAVILTRGGGSMEDLWAFNERIVADAVFRCGLPVVAAIGHETDTTIAELVADVRCATPTQAAMTLIPDEATWRQQIDGLSRRLNMLTDRVMEHAAHRVEAMARHVFFRRPVNMLRPLSDRLEMLQGRLNDAMDDRLVEDRQRVAGLSRHLGAIHPRTRLAVAEREMMATVGRLEMAMTRRQREGQARLEALARHLEAVGPARVLGRGYTYTLDASGRPVTSAAAVRQGDELTTVLADGRVVSRVMHADGRTAWLDEAKDAMDSPAAAASPPPPTTTTAAAGVVKRRRGKAVRGNEAQPGLFSGGLFSGLNEKVLCDEKEQGDGGEAKV